MDPPTYAQAPRSPSLMAWQAQALLVAVPLSIYLRTTIPHQSISLTTVRSVSCRRAQARIVESWQPMVRCKQSKNNLSFFQGFQFQKTDLFEAKEATEISTQGAWVSRLGFLFFDNLAVAALQKQKSITTR